MQNQDLKCADCGLEQVYLDDESGQFKCGSCHAVYRDRSDLEHRLNVKAGQEARRDEVARLREENAALLASCKELVAAMHGYMIDTEDICTAKFWERIGRAEYAIAKATGSEPAK